MFSSSHLTRKSTLCVFLLFIFRPYVCIDFHVGICVIYIYVQPVKGVEFVLLFVNRPQAVTLSKMIYLCHIESMEQQQMTVLSSIWHTTTENSSTLRYPIWYLSLF